MKYQYFFLTWLIITVLLTELASRNVFQSNAISVISWWLKQGDNRVLGSFLVGLFGLLFLVFISARTTDGYVALTGTPETYVFTGDRLREGFYGYRDNDPSRQEVFVPSFLDANVYPCTSFQSLFYRKTILRSPQGEAVKADMLGLGNQTVWSIFTAVVGAVFVAGLLLVFKSYAQGHGRAETNGISDTWQLVQSQTGGKLLWVMLLVLALLILNMVLIRWKTPEPIRDDQPAMPLPTQVQSGKMVIGKIVAAETYNPEPGADRSIHDKRLNRRYTVQFDNRIGFEVPVYLNWDAHRIQENNFDNKSTDFRRVLEIQKIYYNLAFARCDAAQQTKEDVLFMVTDDLRIIPYLEDKKELIPQLLQNLN